MAIFGTDGIRKRFSEWPICVEGCFCIAKSLVESRALGDLKTVLIARDTRGTSVDLERGLETALSNYKIKVTLAGIMPTPALSVLTSKGGFSCGISVTASHNPYTDNGLKIFNANGEKLEEHQAQSIEASFLQYSDSFEDTYKAMNPFKENIFRLGYEFRYNDLEALFYNDYKESLLRSFPKNFSLLGSKIAIDCANGANYYIVPKLFTELGAKVKVVGNKPDGKNINHKVGATCPESIRNLVFRSGADLGISFDGDGDRLIMCDELGNIIDGDVILAVLAKYLHNKGQLANNCVVSTIMSNLGLDDYLSSLGIKLFRSNVGDKLVYDMMKEKGAVLGGEKSGHVILKDFSATGDGLFVALTMIRVLMETGQAPSDAFNIFKPYPQVLRNFPVDKSLLEDEKVKKFFHDINNKINLDGGRLIVRPSGTEPMIRVMVEHADADFVHNQLENIEDFLTNILGY